MLSRIRFGRGKKKWTESVKKKSTAIVHLLRFLQEFFIKASDYFRCSAFETRICLWWFEPCVTQSSRRHVDLWLLTGYAMRGNKSGGYASGYWEPELSHALFKGPPQGTAALMVSMRMYLIAGLWSVHLASRHLWHHSFMTTYMAQIAQPGKALWECECESEV